MDFPNISEVKYLAKGRRGIVYTGIYKNQKVSIKSKKPDSLAKNRINNEIKFLKILNKHKIGPKFLKKGKNYLVYKFVKGTLLPEFLKKEKNKEKRRNILITILKQARTLDKLKINKLEFTKPLKHIFINNSKVTIIDFERSYYTKKPKNVTQFCQYLMQNKLIKKDINILKKYKENQTEKNFKDVIKLIK